MQPAKKLRNLIVEKSFLIAPGVYDALTARIAQYCNFSTIYMSGYATAASYGYPDYGIVTMSEMLDNIRRITEAVDIPLITDGDTGYGNAINAYRTFKEYEKAGAASIQFEDQAWPKRCGHMEGKQVIEASEMVDKIKAALDARINPDTLLIVRTDAVATHGFDEAIQRGELYGEAGADIIFIEAPNEKQVVKIPKLISRPCLLNMALPNQKLKNKAIKNMGYALALYPAITLLGVLGGCIQMMKKLNENGNMQVPSEFNFDFAQLNNFLGLERYRNLEKKFSQCGIK